MSLIIRAIPDRPELYEDYEETVSEPEMILAEKLQSAYQQRFLIYEQQFAGALTAIGGASPASLPPYFHKVSVVFDGEEEYIVFDSTLYEQMLEIYIFEGWKGIIKIEQALGVHIPKAESDSLSGGVKVNKTTLWIITQRFFHFTRNLLALFIRETLIEIERKTAIVIKYGLGVSIEMINKAYETDFVFKREEGEKDFDPDSRFSHPRKQNYKYSCRNQNLSDALFKTLSETVKLRSDYDKLIKKIITLRAQHDQFHTYREQGLASPYNYDETDIAKEIDKEIQSVGQAEKLLASIQNVMSKSSPFGLIVLNGLKVNFTKEDMEQKLGEALNTMRQKTGDINTQIDPSLSRVAAIDSDVIVGQTVAIDAVERWKPPQSGIESMVLDTAFKNLTSDPGWFPLAHEATFHRLVESGVIKKDSFEYVVYIHYVSGLIDLLEDKLKVEQLSDEFWRSFGKIAASLSLILLVTPVTAEFAPILKGLSTMAGLITMANSIYSVIGDLKRLDQTLAGELVHPDAFALEHLARIGELTQIRREAIVNVTQQIALELVFSAGSSFNVVKKMLLTRGYYYDLEALISDGEEN